MTYEEIYKSGRIYKSTFNCHEIKPYASIVRRRHSEANGILNLLPKKKNNGKPLLEKQLNNELNNENIQWQMLSELNFYK